MSESSRQPDSASVALAGLVRALGELDQGVDDAVRIDRIRLLEELKAAAAAAQAVETAAFVAAQRERQRAAGVPAERIGRGIASQVALARRVSPWQAQRYVGWANVLTSELPHTLTALHAGQVTEWRALIVARETIWLSREHRLAVDAELAPRLGSLGDRGVEREAQRIGYRLDPHGYLARTKGAASDRRVTIRPAPEVMARLTVFAPAAQAVAGYAALLREADARIAAGDPRSRGQIMADTAVERLTGQTTADQVPVEVEVVIDADTLLGGNEQPAQLAGYGPIPAPLARQLIGHAEQAWLRRLFTRPTSRQLIGMDTRRRTFTAGQRRFIALRDQHCRTPYCQAPIRHTDHVKPAEAGGPTSLHNGQGLCAACNFAKQAPGWRSTPAHYGTQTIITTPTGHTYTSRAPDPPGPPPPPSTLEHHLRRLLAA